MTTRKTTAKSPTGKAPIEPRPKSPTELIEDQRMQLYSAEALARCIQRTAPEDSESAEGAAGVLADLLGDINEELGHVASHFRSAK